MVRWRHNSDYGEAAPIDEADGDAYPRGPDPFVSTPQMGPSLTLDLA